MLYPIRQPETDVLAKQHVPVAVYFASAKTKHHIPGQLLSVTRRGRNQRPRARPVQPSDRPDRACDPAPVREDRRYARSEENVLSYALSPSRHATSRTAAMIRPTTAPSKGSTSPSMLRKDRTIWPAPIESTHAPSQAPEFYVLPPCPSEGGLFFETRTHHGPRRRGHKLRTKLHTAGEI